MSFLLLSLPVCFLRPRKYLLKVLPGAALGKTVVLEVDVQTGGYLKSRRGFRTWAERMLKKDKGHQAGVGCRGAALLLLEPF